MGVYACIYLPNIYIYIYIYMCVCVCTCSGAIVTKLDFQNNFEFSCH